MEELDMDCNLDDEDYSSTKQSGGKVTWMIDKGIWLGKKAVITGAVISSAPLVLPPLLVFSTLGFACSVPFGFVFATYACTQKIMSKLLPTPESSYVLEYEDELYDEDDSVEGVGERGYDVDNDDDLVQGVGEQGYEVDDDDDLVQGVEEQGFEKGGLIEEIMIEEIVKEAMKDAQADVNKEIDNLQQPIEHWEVGIKNNEQKKQFDTIRLKGIELDGRDDILPEGAALLQEDVLYGKNGIDKYIEQPLEEEILEADVVEGFGLKTELDDNATRCVEIHKPKQVGEDEELEKLMEGGDGAVEMNVNDSAELEVEDTILAQVADANKGVEQVKSAIDVLQGVGMIAKLDESATDSGDFDHKQKSKMKEEHLEEVLEGDVGMSELNATDRSEHEGGDTFQAPVDDGQKGFEKQNEEPLEQDEKVLDMLQGAGMISELDEYETDSGDFHKQKSKRKEEQSEKVMEGGAGTSELEALDSSEHEIGNTIRAPVDNVQQGFKKHNEEPLEKDEKVLDMLQGVGIISELDEKATDSSDFDKKKSKTKEEQPEEELEGGVGTSELNAIDSSEHERGDTIWAPVDDVQKGFEKHNEEPLKQDEKVLDMLQEVGMTVELDENATDSSESDKKISKTEDEQWEKVLEGSVGTSVLNANDSSEHERGDTIWAPADDVQKGFDKHSEEPLEQDEKVLDMLQGVGMIAELEENAIDSGDFDKIKSKTKEEQTEEVLEGGVRTSELNAIDSSEHERGDTAWAPVDDRQMGFKKDNEEPLGQDVKVPELQRMVHMKNELEDNANDSVEIQKIEPVSEEEQLKEIVEGGATIIELKNAYAVLKEEVVPLDGGMLMRNAIVEEAKSPTQGKGILQADADNEQNSVKKHGKRPTGHSHEGSYKEDVTKSLLGEDILPLHKTEVQNKKLILEDKNEGSVTEMQRVIVRVQGGNNIVREQEIKDIKEWNKSEKLVLVTRHVTEETAGKKKKLIIEDKNEEPVMEMQRVIARVQGGKNIVREQESKESMECNKAKKLVLVTRHVPEETAGNMYNEEMLRGKLGLLENIRDEPKSGLGLELGELSDSTDERRKILNAPHTSSEGKIMVHKGKGDSSMHSEISTKIFIRPIEEKVDPEDYVGPKNIWSDLSSAREIADECGLDLFDYTAGNHNSYNDYSIPQENNNIRSRKTDDIANLPGLRVFTSEAEAEAKHVNYLPENDHVTPYREELLDDDKIWEQIDALRTIVGYSAPRHTTSIEEIKALYIFTGVEPPPSIADDSDIVDVNEKLQLLKTVVGVK